MKLGLSGIKGSFSEGAALAYLQKNVQCAELVYCLDMKGVLHNLNESHIDMGIFPVCNSIGGLVDSAFEAMGLYTFKVVAKLAFEVNQCLLTPSSLKKEQIKHIASHPQALAQCKNYLNKNFPNVTLIKWSDTASAAQDLICGKLPENSAVLASKEAANYGLDVFAEKVQDNHPNITTFIIVRRLTPSN